MGLLDITLGDDLDVAIDPETYVDQQSPAPPVAGNYNFRIKKLGVRKNKEGEPVLTDDRWPIYVLEMVDIVEPESLARGVGLFQDLKTKPFERNGVAVMEVGDLIRAIDQSRSLRGLEAIDEALAEFVGTEATFRGYLDWSAYDSAFVKAALAEAGLTGQRYASMSDSDKKVASDIYKKAKLSGMKKFPKLANGRHSHIWTGPSGESIEARPRITRFYPSLEEIRLIAA